MDKDHSQEQIQQWLKKLEQESWQLELLVSAFTIFLLIQASAYFSEFYEGLTYEYNFNNTLALIYFFFTLIGYSIKSLILFLIIHLLLRGFWIGSIGLRSVQSTIDYSKLNYSPFFEEKLKKKVISLDNLVMMLDEICSVIFSFSFLVISMLLAFGLFQFFLWGIAILFGSVIGITTGFLSTLLTIIGSIISISVFLAGLIYFIDYFTLGFFKKIKWFGKIYYPFYRLMSFITLSVISRSIYYYLISKFSKRRIRVVYLVMAVLLVANWLIEYDQYQYYPDVESAVLFDVNNYDDQRPEKQYIREAALATNVTGDAFVQLFIRYDPSHNADIQKHCPEFQPAKNEGINLAVDFEVSGGNLVLSDKKLDEDSERLVNCLSGFYQVSINNIVYNDLEFYYMRHPAKGQRGLMSMIPTNGLPKGQNLLQINRYQFDPSDSISKLVEYDNIVFWTQ